MILQGLSPLIYEGKSYDVSNYAMPPSFNMGWVLVRFLLVITSVQQQNMEKQLGISFTYENKVQPGWYHVFMDEKQYKIASQIEFIKLYDPKSFKNIKREISEDGKYIVMATKDWKPKNKYMNVKNVYNEFYVVRNTTLQELNEDPYVKRAARQSQMKLFNRFAGGALQDGKATMAIQDNQIIAHRSLQAKGINGHNQIVTVLDSGLDIGHCFFHDKDHNYTTVINKTNLNHRKVVRYESATDDFTDFYQGHGTHVMGTVAGESWDPIDPIAAYNGVAPKAKLYVVDVSISEEDDEAVAFLSEAQFNHIIKQMKKLNSKVMSNSWGYDEQNSAIDTKLYDEVGMHTTFVAACGNQNKKNAIYTPADSKNVITVGWTTRPIASQVETGDVNVNLTFPDGFACPVLSGFGVLFAPIEFVLDFCDDRPENCVYKPGTVMLSPLLPRVPLNFKFCIVAPEHYAHIKANYVNSTIFIVPRDKSQKLEMNDDSSRGTTLLGTLKPDVVAPGTSTYSAYATGLPPWNVGQCIIENTLGYSGSSMATPAVSGSIALIYEYFEEGWYPTNTKTESNAFTPDPITVKSVLINSAKSINNKVVPNYDQGFGMPRINEGLGFEGVGMRTTKFTLEPESHYVVKVKTTRWSEFSATIAYNDPSTSTENNVILLIDMDLIVRDPDGNVYYGNNVKGEYTTNTEKVYIKGAPEGEYSIEIIYPRVNDEWDSNWNVSLTVTGGFDQTDQEKNPKDLVATKIDTCVDDCNGGTCNKGMCVCNATRIGTYCQHELHVIPETSKIDISLTPREIYYFAFENSNFNVRDTLFNAKSYIPNRVKVCLSAEPPRTPTNGEYCGIIEKKHSNITFPKDINSTVYGFIYTINHDAHDFSFTVNDVLPSEAAKKNKKFPIWVGGLVGGVFAALVCATIVYIVKYIRIGKIYDEEYYPEDNNP